MAHLFILILPSSHCSSASTMHTVSFRRLPLISTVSPRKSESSSIVCVFSATTELSSFPASSTTRRLGFFFFAGFVSAMVASVFLGRSERSRSVSVAIHGLTR